MVNMDVGYRLNELNKRLTELEGVVMKGTLEPDLSEQFWDNSTLMQQWKISKRTAAYYRKKGLNFLKIGGRIYYPPEGRAKFIMECNQIEREDNL